LIFLDTNVVSEPVRKTANPLVVDWLNRNEGQTRISSVVLAEIAFGIFSIKSAERSPRFLDQLLYVREKYANRIHAFDEKASIFYGRLVGERKLSGRHMTILDGMIAAIALRHNASLATRNIRHFQGIGLTLINPWET
jgi:predicted nucleic acid-binding protein